ncbi:MAG: Crp/Fnr family transcriptional regulator [Thiohalomonadales bacterium]
MKDFARRLSTDFLSSLSQQDRAQLFAIGCKKSYAKDEMIFHVGSNSDDVSILLDGRVKIYELSAEGKEVILWFCFTGEVFGLAEVLRRENREVNALACTPVDVLSIKHTDFQAFLRTHPDVSQLVIELLSGRLRELGDVLLNLASDDVTSRVIKLITRLGSRYGKTYDKGVFLDIPLTHQEMADMIGTSRQTVTTVLGNLKKQGVLRTEQRAIYIQNAEFFESIC